MSQLPDVLIALQQEPVDDSVLNSKATVVAGPRFQAVLVALRADLAVPQVPKMNLDGLQAASPNQDTTMIMRLSVLAAATRRDQVAPLILKINLDVLPVLSQKPGTTMIMHLSVLAAAIQLNGAAPQVPKTSPDAPQASRLRADLRAPTRNPSGQQASR